MMNNIYKIIIAIYLHTQLSCFNFIYVVRKHSIEARQVNTKKSKITF